ncbi:MAG TPA: UDP-glucose/GDP-mannose dehydrogenase family protein [Candidatus Obscuribacterales bacterium]
MSRRAAGSTVLVDILVNERRTSPDIDIKDAKEVDVCVIGAGYVGLVTSCALAHLGNNVVLVEANKQKLELLKAGQTPFFEPGLDDILAALHDTDVLRFTDNIEDGVKKSEIIFIAVGTPPKSSGEPDLSQVMAVAKAIGAALDTTRARLIVNKSTVPVGSGNWVEMLVSQGVQALQTVSARSGRAEMPCFQVASNPEFLREGSALHDTFYPDRIVLGCTDETSAELLRTLYKPIIRQTFDPPSGVPRPPKMENVPVLITDLASAEMIKYSANAFLAMKISFANEIANLCEKVGADVRQVARGIGLDTRIGRQFLNAGVGWGGSCFGKDVNALIDVAREYNCSTSLLEATLKVNTSQRAQLITKLQEELKIIKGRTIGLMGLSFKPDTDDLRDAPSLAIASLLQKMGAQVRAYDPVSNEACERMHADLNIIYCRDVQQLAEGVDALVLVTEWEEFKVQNWNELGKLMRKRLIIDGRNCLPEDQLRDAGFTYRGIGH